MLTIFAVPNTSGMSLQFKFRAPASEVCNSPFESRNLEKQNGRGKCRPYTLFILKFIALKIPARHKVLNPCFFHWFMAFQHSSFFFISQILYTGLVIKVSVSNEQKNKFWRLSNWWQTSCTEVKSLSDFTDADEIRFGVQCQERFLKWRREMNVSRQQLEGNNANGELGSAEIMAYVTWLLETFTEKGRRIKIELQHD